MVTGGGLVDLAGRPSERGPFAQPTLVRVDGLDLAEHLPAVTEETFFPLLPVVVPTDAETGPDLLDRITGLLNRNRYGLRNSLWTASPTTIDRFLDTVTNGGTGLSGGPHGEAYYPLLRATRLQAVSIGTHIDVTTAPTTAT